MLSNDAVDQFAFAGIDEARQRLDGTFVFYPEFREWVSVSKVFQHPENNGIYLILRTSKGHVETPVRNIDSRAPTLGLFMFKGSVYRALRGAERNYKRGLPPKSVIAVDSNGVEKFLVDYNMIVSPGFQDMLLNEYPMHVISMVGSGAYESAPLSRRVWIKGDRQFEVIKMCYENHPIVMISKDGKMWTGEETPFRTFLATKYESLINLVKETYCGS